MLLLLEQIVAWFKGVLLTSLLTFSIVFKETLDDDNNVK